MMQMSIMAPKDHFWGKWLVFPGMAQNWVYFPEEDGTDMVAAMGVGSASLPAFPPPAPYPEDS